MHFVHKISLMIHTASPDDFLSGQGIPSYYRALLENLRRQTIKEFELVYVDTFHDSNRDRFGQYVAGLPFITKHVPVHHEHRYWFDRGYTYISAAKNTGIIHADGELCVTCDDAEFFPDDLLERYWRHYKSGHLMLGMHKRMKSIKTHDGLPSFPITGDIYINDHRFNTISERLKYHTNGSWGFAGTSFPLVDAINLNGFNEKMDGCKSLEDCEFATRLQMLGRKFVQDKDGFVYILDHQSYSEMRPTNWEPAQGQDCQESPIPPIANPRKKIDNLIAVENFGMYQCAVKLNRLKANRSAPNQDEMKIIREETLKYRGFDPLAPENSEKLAVWMGVPNFDIASQRKTLRSSREWRW